MKQRTRKGLLVVAGTVLLAALPVVGSLYFTYLQTLSRAHDRAALVADTVARQATDVLLGAEAAIADVIFIARRGCTIELVHAFQVKSLTLTPITGMGYVAADGHLRCTAFGFIEPPLPVTHHSLIKPEGAIVWFSPPAETPYAPGLSIAASHFLRTGDSIVATFAPHELVRGRHLAALGEGSGLQVRMAGTILASEGAQDDKKFLEATRELGIYDTVVSVRASRDAALAPWRDTLFVTAGTGALAGLLLALGALRLARRRPSPTSEIREGLANREFEIWYQPVIDLQAGRCSGAEALIRWRHPKRDLMPPSLFIALAEESGAIIPLTRWLMREVATKMASLLHDDPSLHIAINLAPAHVTNLDIVDDARTIFTEFCIQPSQVLFELTERGLMDHPACREVIATLSSLGAEVAIDDFGTGYSSLAYIDKFKIDYVKIDKVFVSAIGLDAPSARLIDVIIDMAEALALKTIAEGVETPQQASFLRDRGVNYAQGYHFSPPLPADAFRRYAQRHRIPGATRFSDVK